MNPRKKMPNIKKISPIRILKDWTLPVAMTMGTLIYLLFANIDAFDPIAQQAGPFFDKILPLFMFFILFTIVANNLTSMFENICPNVFSTVQIFFVGLHFQLLRFFIFGHFHK